MILQVAKRMVNIRFDSVCPVQKKLCDAIMVNPYRSHIEQKRRIMPGKDTNQKSQHRYTSITMSALFLTYFSE